MNFHYLLMSGHAIYLKQLIAQLNHTGLTPGQPKVLDYLMAHDGANQREIADACHIAVSYTHLDVYKRQASIHPPHKYRSGQGPPLHNKHASSRRIPGYP